jgi:hypothetical protein
MLVWWESIRDIPILELACKLMIQNFLSSLQGVFLSCLRFGSTVPHFDPLHRTWGDHLTKRIILDSLPGTSSLACVLKSGKLTIANRTLCYYLCVGRFPSTRSCDIGFYPLHPNLLRFLKSRRSFLRIHLASIRLVGVMAKKCLNLVNQMYSRDHSMPIQCLMCLPLKRD